jgi:hypothetical protein
LVLEIPSELDQQGTTDEKRFERVTVETFDVDLFVGPTLHDAVAGLQAQVTLAESDFYLVVQGVLRGAHQSQVTEFFKVFVKSA